MATRDDGEHENAGSKRPLDDDDAPAIPAGKRTASATSITARPASMDDAAFELYSAALAYTRTGAYRTERLADWRDQVRLVVTTMRANLADELVCADCCTAMSGFTLAGRNRSISMERRLAIVRAGGVDAMVCAAKQHPRSVDVCTGALVALSRICKDSAARTALLVVIKMLVATLTANHDPAVSTECCAIICHIAKCGYGRDDVAAIVAAGGIEALVQTIARAEPWREPARQVRMHESRAWPVGATPAEAVLAGGCAALAACIRRDPDSAGRALLADGSLIGALCECIRQAAFTRPRGSAVCLSLCRVFRVLAAAHVDDNAVLINSQVDGLVGSLMGAYPANDGLFVSCSAILADLCLVVSRYSVATIEKIPCISAVRTSTSPGRMASANGLLCNFRPSRDPDDCLIPCLLVVGPSAPETPLGPARVEYYIPLAALNRRERAELRAHKWPAVPGPAMYDVPQALPSTAPARTLVHRLGMGGPEEYPSYGELLYHQIPSNRARVVRVHEIEHLI
jgi:hypothetical protein